MHSFTTLATILLIGASTVAANPLVKANNVGKLLPDMAVLIRGSDSSFAHSEDMADLIRARLVAGQGEFSLADLTGDSAAIARRDLSSGTIQACTSSSCTGCTTVFSGSVQGGTGCIHAAGTQCLIISNLANANVQYWSGTDCTGRNTVYRGCGTNTVRVGAPDTNSLGLHSGC